MTRSFSRRGSQRGFVLLFLAAASVKAQTVPVDVRSLVDGARLGAGYLFGPDVKGWTVGLSFQY